MLLACHPGLSGMLPPAPTQQPCPLRSGRDNKTNNFLDPLSWTPFIFPEPQGRADLVVGPWCGSCTALGAGPGRPGWAGPGLAGLSLLGPAASALCLHSSPAPCPPSPRLVPAPSLCFCLSLSLPLSTASLPPSPGPSAGRLSRPLCRCLAGLGRPRWRFSLGSSVQLLPGSGSWLAGREEVPSWGVPELAGPSSLEYRGPDSGLSHLSTLWDRR